MTSKSFQVPNIGCAGCVAAIKTELEDLSGVQTVSGDLPSKTIQIEFETPATWDNIVATLKDIDYPPADS
ncbi:MAG: heavy-metal-associated domain-containing protein [Chloroflexota bacterium]|nr:heavy-metal-associated domain-containing protein [Chloroflexota bacterium]MDE2857711.1 heavy-metal-associated domain-containing protein [Chloroflexota bacterium]MDE2950511.1 heavy-metal-associated domain-containing protein [Chloroflexota bacterium]